MSWTLAVARMLRATSPHEAERLRLSLEWELLPNQVLQQGAADLTREIFDGLAVATSVGAREAWEILAQLAAGAAAGPTAADPRVVEETQGVFSRMVGRVAACVSGGVEQTHDYLAVDVLDAVLTFAAEPVRAKALAAVRCFARRGARQARRASIIIEAFES